MQLGCFIPDTCLNVRIQTRTSWPIACYLMMRFLVYLVFKKLVLNLLHPFLVKTFILPSSVIRAGEREGQIQISSFASYWFDVGKSSTFHWGCVVYDSYQKTLIFGKFLTYHLSYGWSKFRKHLEVHLWNMNTQEIWEGGRWGKKGSRVCFFPVLLCFIGRKSRMLL